MMDHREERNERAKARIKELQLLLKAWAKEKTPSNK